MTNDDMDRTPDVDTDFDNFLRDLVEFGDAQDPAMSGLDVIMAISTGDTDLDAAVNELTMTHFGTPLTDSLVDDITEEIDARGDNFND